MTLIVKNVAKLVMGFIGLFGVYITMTGHLAPGGGFAGAVIVAVAAVLMVLAFGGAFSRKLVTEPQCHIIDAIGAIGFLVIALLGYITVEQVGGAFFHNFLPPGRPFHLMSGGTILLSNLAILVKVAGGLVGVLLALFAFRIGTPEE